MSGRPSRKSAEIGRNRPFSAFFALFRRVQRAPGKSRKRRKKAFFLRYPQICLNPHLLNPHLLNPHLRHTSNVKELLKCPSMCLFQSGSWLEDCLRVETSSAPYRSLPDFRGHSVRHSRGHSGLKGPRDSCRGPTMSQL